MTARVQNNLWLWVAPAAILLAGTVATMAMRLGWTYPCPFKLLFDLPCLTCGGTRAFAALASFQIIEAIRYNPLLIAGSLGLAVALLFPMLRRRLAAVPLPFVVVAVLMNWVYLILFLPR